MSQKRKSKRNTVCVTTIGGEYHASSGHRQVLKPYEIDCKFDQEMIKNGVLSTFKNTLAPVMMKRKYPDYVGLYTHEIRESKMVDESGEEWAVEDIDLMNRDQLVEYIGDLFNPDCAVDPDLYTDASELRTAVHEWLNAVQKGKTDDWIKGQERRRERKGDSLARASRALSLNALDDVDPKQVVLQQQLNEYAVARSGSGQANAQAQPEDSTASSPTVEKSESKGQSEKPKDKADKTLTKI